jgi:hypothetical protein
MSPMNRPFLSCCRLAAMLGLLPLLLTSDRGGIRRAAGFLFREGAIAFDP